MNKDDKRQTVLVVDDTPENIDVLVGILKDEYKVKVALNGEKALQVVVTSQEPPDVILLDIMMPVMDGFEVCRRLKQSAITRSIPVIFVTAKGEVEDEARGFKLGAVDYITKPVSPPIVKARIKTHLKLYNQKRVIEEMVKERTMELAVTQDVILRSVANLAETRENETGGHIMRTQRYVQTLAEQLMSHPSFRNYLNETVVDTLYKITPLHDIGKVGVPDNILLKPGKLDNDEFAEMKKHAVYGRETIQRAADSFIEAGQKETSTFLETARELAYTHHEKWNGNGYPEGSAGGEIHFSGRIMAVADVYDALISKKPYKQPFSHSKAVEIIKQEKGVHFDPAIVDAFLDNEQLIRLIAIEFADNDEQRELLRQ
jgi:putative two-component system response regulator